MLAEVQSTVRSVFGQSVTLHGQHRDALTVTAVVGPIGGEQVESDEGKESRRKRTVSFSRAVIGEPGDWNKVVIDGMTWTIRQPPVNESGDLVVFEVLEISSMARSYKGYRGAG